MIVNGVFLAWMVENGWSNLGLVVGKGVDTKEVS